MSQEARSPVHFLDVAVEAAREAGTIIAQAANRPKNISYKGEVDLVTETDHKSEAAILARLRHHFPAHAIVAEEGGASGPQAPSPYKWYVDPLDGTTNFAHGYPMFAVSIGLLENNEPLIGAVYNPVTCEMFTAIRNEGAYRDGARIRVSSVAKLSKSLLATGFPSHKRVQNPNIHYYWEFTLHSHGVRRAGSAALDLCSVACGQFEGFWEFGLKPWDTAAGMLLVREAGGMVTDFAGQLYHPGDAGMLASNGLVHAEMQALAANVAAQAPANVAGSPG
ncbi:MAG TPA: inositol monophosphatase family protein [Candidatus Limnocylindrales bacterium]|nr:inositol monophosphatase family protein [Candidatus Limnocylindrales bacterium]